MLAAVQSFPKVEAKMFIIIKIVGSEDGVGFGFEVIQGAISSKSSRTRMIPFITDRYIDFYRLYDYLNVEVGEDYYLDEYIVMVYENMCYGHDYILCIEYASHQILRIVCLDNTPNLPKEFDDALKMITEDNSLIKHKKYERLDIADRYCDGMYRILSRNPDLAICLNCVCHHDLSKGVIYRRFTHLNSNTDDDVSNVSSASIRSAIQLCVGVMQNVHDYVIYVLNGVPKCVPFLTYIAAI